MTNIDPSFPDSTFDDTTLNTDSFLNICFRTATTIEKSDAVVFTLPSIYVPKFIGTDTWDCTDFTGLCRTIPNPIANGKHDIFFQSSTEYADNTNHCGKIPYITPY